MVIHMLKLQMKLIFKNSTSLLQFFLLPTVLVLIIGYLAKDSFNGRVTSYQYYSIGVMLFMYSGFGVIGAFNFIDKFIREGNLRLVYMPINESWIFATHIVSGSLYGILTITVNMVIFGILFGVNYYNNFWIILLLYTSIVLSSSTFGILLSILIDNTIVIEEIFTISQLVLCLLGGCFFSIESIASLPTFFAYMSPVKWIMDGLVNGIFLNDTTKIFIIIPINLLISVIIVIFCKMNFKTEKYL